MSTPARLGTIEGQRSQKERQKSSKMHPKTPLKRTPRTNPSDEKSASYKQNFTQIPHPPGFRQFGWIQRLGPGFLGEVHSNCSIDAVSLYPAYRKPFDMIAKRAKNEEWSALADDFRTFFQHSDHSESPVLA
jgi:hypothetical protein